MTNTVHPIDCFTSIVVPVTNNAEKITDFIKELSSVLQETYTNYEIILIDNGSIDDTVTIIQPLLIEYPCIRLIRLSRTYDREIAIFAGLEVSIGDYVITVIPTSDPISAIPEIVDHLRKGKDIIYGITTKPRHLPLFSRLGLNLFRKYSRKILGATMPANSTYLIGLNRRAVNAITRIRSHSRHIRILINQVGFDNKAFPYTPLKSDPYLERTLGNSISMAIDISVNYSRHPLRFVSYLGIIASLVNLLYGVYVVFIYLFDKQVVQGWTTLSLQTSTMFFLVFLILTVLSEYIGRILEETKEQPSYHVMEELTSTVALASSSRRNIHK